MKKVIKTIQTGMMTAFIEMKSHKMRSLLSMIGVLLGVASLVAMLTLVGGIKVYLENEMGDIAGSIWIIPRGDVPDDQRSIWSRTPGMKLSDGTYLKNTTKRVDKFMRRIVRWGDCRVLGVKDDIRFAGVDTVTFNREMKDAFVGRGRSITKDEFELGVPVCIISWKIEERLLKRLSFGHGSRKSVDLLGKSLTMHGVRYKIVGIIEPDDKEFAYWQIKRTALAPIKSVQKKMSGTDPHPGHLELSLKNWQELSKETSFVSKLLKNRHRGIEDFEIKTADWLEEMTSMLNNASILILVISVISLLAGGLSIMNVMLSSISERIQEIGTRKALGARNSQIFVQFIAETVTLCITGGAFGMVLGLIPLFFKDAIKRSTGGTIIPTILPEHILYVVLVITAIGVVFGLYPAVKAARMNPIDALRYE